MDTKRGSIEDCFFFNNLSACAAALSYERNLIASKEYSALIYTEASTTALFQSDCLYVTIRSIDFDRLTTIVCDMAITAEDRAIASKNEALERVEEAHVRIQDYDGYLDKSRRVYTFRLAEVLDVLSGKTKLTKVKLYLYNSAE
jgi:hypothetical protein